MGSLWNDLRYGARMLWRSPGFTAVAALTLALGIGANTAIFSLVNAIVLRPLPVRNPAELVSIYTSDFSGPIYGSSSYPDYADIRANCSDVISGVLAYSITPVNLRSGERTERVMAELASEDYFRVLGIEASPGRVFSPEEGRLGAAAPVTVLSHGFWKRRFGSDPGVVGRSVTINGQPFTVLGVAPEKLSGMTRVIDVDIWAPLAALPPDLNDRGSRSLFLMGRLQSGKTADEAQTRLRVLAAQLHQAYPQNWTDLHKQPRKLTVVPESSSRVPMQARTPILTFLALLLAVVGLVLLIACANIASLLLARATARQREIGVRLAMGAGRGRLIRQLITENIVLSALGGGAGLMLAIWLNSMLMAFRPPLPVAITLDLSLDYRVLGFTMLASILTGALFGLAPALQATRMDIVASLKGSTGASGGALRRFSLRNLLVVAQVAACVVLLIGAGLFLRSLRNVYDIDPGFQTGNMLLMTVDLGRQGYSAEKGIRFQQQFVERVRSLPGVQASEFAQVAALGLEAMQRTRLQIDGYNPRPGEDMEVHFNFVGPRYFDTMGLPLVRGRSYTEQDREGAPPVVIVNEAFASRYWPNQNPIGKRIARGQIQREVIGIAKNAKYISLGEEARPYVYLPMLQSYQPEATLHIRTAGDPSALVAAVRREAELLDKELPLIGIKSFSEHMGVSLLPARAAAATLSAFGLLALLLAATGLYGVIAYAVTQRTREIGIRMAMGARRMDVLAMVVTQGMALALAGIVIGIAGAYGVTRLLTTMLFGVSATDPATFAGVALMLALVALAACFSPARRATRVDPMIALRYE